MLCYIYTIRFAVQCSLCTRHLALSAKLNKAAAACDRGPLAHLPVDVPVMSQHNAQHLDPLHCVANSYTWRCNCALSGAPDIGTC